MPELTSSGFMSSGISVTPQSNMKFTTGSVSAAAETPKQLRKRAKQVEKANAKAQAARKAQRKASKQRAREEASARAALVAVAADETKGYARVWAARSILGLDS